MLGKNVQKIDIVGCSIFRIFLVIAFELFILVHATNDEKNDITEWNNFANDFANELHLIQNKQQAAFILQINCRSTRRYITPRSSQNTVLVGIR